MTAASTLDYADYADAAATVVAEPVVVPADAPDDVLRRIREGSSPRPDLGARARLGSLLYQITGWDLFADAAEEAGYAVLATEHATEDQERRRVARRRRPQWADEG